MSTAKNSTRVLICWVMIAPIFPTLKAQRRPAPSHARQLSLAVEKEKLTRLASPWCRPTDIGVPIIAAKPLQVEIGPGHQRTWRSLIMMSLLPKKQTLQLPVVGRLKVSYCAWFRVTGLAYSGCLYQLPDL